RCLYCSFTSYPIAVYNDKVEAYLDALEKEMEYDAEAYSRKKLISIYIGGGTPSSISAENMDSLCGMIERAFDLSYVREF
ncbi:coproporphyrinogen dehydrogenase HemZ, partial [Coprococcus eutactus]|nr:coproporphyrinogen dehydrogenase HemZ [Coprococcus eutactus]